MALRTRQKRRRGRALIVDGNRRKPGYPFAPHYKKGSATALAAVRNLRNEIELLTTYSTDTIYRLRYETMRYDYISPSVASLLGYHPEELQEIGLRNLIVETRIVQDDMRKVDNFSGLELNRKLGNVTKWQADYLMKHKSGAMLWVSDISYPWYGEKGTIIGSVGSLRDISERVAAEERVKKELVRLANTDPLTGTANRRAFFARLEDELKRIRRTREDVSVAIIDVDHFKKINDTFGHVTGDVVLKGLAKLIQSCLRETDLLARLGGEEFGIIFPDTPEEGAYWVAERIRSVIAKHSFKADEKQKKPVGCTVSIGLASAHHDADTSATNLYKMADGRLYIAKQTGRNQVSMDELVNVH